MLTSLSFQDACHLGMESFCLGLLNTWRKAAELPEQEARAHPEGQQSWGMTAEEKKNTSVFFSKETGGEGKKNRERWGNDKDKKEWTTFWSMREQDGRDVCIYYHDGSK